MDSSPPPSLKAIEWRAELRRRDLRAPGYAFSSFVARGVSGSGAAAGEDWGEVVLFVL